MISLKYTQHARLDSELSFMDKNNREIVGIVDEVNISIDKYQCRIWYKVYVEDKPYLVDGECFREIYKK